jgi:hypothetical protein
MKADPSKGILDMPSIVYQWREGVSEEDIADGYECLDRVTADMLLPGATSLDQIKCKISESRDAIEGEYTPPSNFYNSKRTAVQAALALPNVNVGNVTDQIIQRMHGTSRATAAAKAINKAKKENKTLKFRIELPVKVNKRFTARDDWGQIIRGFKGIRIGVYSHDNEHLRQAQQYVYVLHLEMTDERRDSLDAQAGDQFVVMADIGGL